MIRKKQPARMNRYANLAAGKKSHAKSRRKPSKLSKWQKPEWFWRLSRKKKLLVLAIPVLAFLILTPIITYLIYANDIKDQERLMNRNNTGIVLTDINDNEIYSIGKAERRNMVKLADISPEMKNALLASEDKDFYKHGGFSVFSIFRAFFTRVGGGSTITQQLAKNTVLSDEHSYIRKYQELAVAIAIEQNYSKDEILEMYLNSVYYGENAFGIDEAAKVYFGKAPKDLTLAESAMLVGVLPAPSAYSPITGNPEYAKQRQTTVLTRMVRAEFIDESQKEAALAEELTYASDGTPPESVAPHFVEMVITQLSKKYGYEKVMRSGYRVKTTLDVEAQKALNENVAAAMPYINRQQGSNASAVVLDPTTGEVRALVGSADYENEQWGKVNMVTTARQPGSSMKPIYYAGALADGVITASSTFKDELTDFGGGYTPRNANRQWHGDVTVRESLNWSLNIPSIKVMQKYGISRSVAAANKLGLNLDTNKQHDLTLALGSSEVSLMRMSNAYAAFANQGQQYAENAVIREVRDKFDKTILQNTSESTQAINKEGAYLISNILSDSATRARIFGSSITVPGGRTVAVKTGTTDDARDAWTIGYTPQYVVGVWVGNNDNAAMLSGGSDMAGPIFRGTMTRLLSGKQNTPFQMPSSIVQRDVCKGTGGLAAKKGANTYTEYFMSGALPTNSCTVEPTMIDVCELSTGKVINIDEENFDAAKHNKDTANCKPPTIQVCELATGKVISIEESKFDSTKHSKTTTGCTATGTDDDDEGTGTGSSTTPTLPRGLGI